jgi:hypothetical protein
MCPVYLLKEVDLTCISTEECSILNWSDFKVEFTKFFTSYNVQYITFVTDCQTGAWHVTETMPKRDFTTTLAIFSSRCSYVSVSGFDIPHDYMFRQDQAKREEIEAEGWTCNTSCYYSYGHNRCISLQARESSRTA